MSFNREQPVNGTKIDADFLRGQFNDLDDREKALASQIAAIPPAEKGDKGDPGNDGQPGIQGPAGNDGQRGPVGPAYNMCGAWVAGQNYNAGDAVNFNGLQLPRRPPS